MNDTISSISMSVNGNPASSRHEGRTWTRGQRKPCRVLRQAYKVGGPVGSSKYEVMRLIRIRNLMATVEIKSLTQKLLIQK